MEVGRSRVLGSEPQARDQVAGFSRDALGRFRTRVLAGSTDTYSYAAGSETVLRVASSGGTTTDSLVSPSGDRLGLKQGSTLNWLAPDLHGNVAASLDAAEATVVSATRYDAFGETLGSGSGGGTAVGTGLWKYQGRLDVSPSGLNTPLYDMSARFYSPGLGAFTQLDSVMGSAQNPLSMNRFLYALANPATLIDPDGHMACAGWDDDCQYFRKQELTRAAAATKKWQAARAARSRSLEWQYESRSRRDRSGRTNAQIAAERQFRIDAAAADARESRVVTTAGVRQVTAPARPSTTGCIVMCGFDPVPSLVVGGAALVGGAICLLGGCELLAAAAGAAAATAAVGAVVGGASWAITTIGGNLAAGNDWSTGLSVEGAILSSGTGAVVGAAGGATFGALAFASSLPEIGVAASFALGSVSGPVSALVGMGFKAVTGQPITAADGWSALFSMVPIPNRIGIQVAGGIIFDQAANGLGR